MTENAKTLTMPIMYFIVLFLIGLKMVFMMDANLLVEEAYYWNYARHLDFGYLDHPPMVAWLIKSGTYLFGSTEWGVRFATLPCWLITVLYSYKLTNLLRDGAGKYSIFLLSILPFFFTHALVITPDIPLITCWSASLYYLYKALVEGKNLNWYSAGIAIGLGLLSKYTIVLLGPATIVYMILDKNSRTWFRKKEPYLCALIALLLFSPVIYWNYTHAWVSFLFQSSRRFHGSFSFSLPEFLGLLFVFLTPIGVLGGIKLFMEKLGFHTLPKRTHLFLMIFSLVPLGFFAVFSVSHSIKINWIGPSLLALIPWLSLLLFDNTKAYGMECRKYWAITAFILTACYTGLLICLVTGQPKDINQKLFSKIMYWDNLALGINNIAANLENSTQQVPILVSLDSYHIASELTFYQQKFLNEGKIKTAYHAMSRHVFGIDSLMYNYWDNQFDMSGQLVILIAKELDLFSYASIATMTTPVTQIQELLVDNTASPTLKQKFYFQVVKIT